MKTFTKTKTTNEPRLRIVRDDNSPSPREDSTLGYWITVDREYQSPDDMPTMRDIVKETGDEATSQEEHIALIKKEIEACMPDDKVLAIYPTVKYEHGGVAYHLGTVHNWDYSNNGFYIITKKSQEELGTEAKDFEKVIKQEIEVFNKWANGDVYGFTLYDEQGELIDSCRGFYEPEDIQNHLPEDWKTENLEDYLTD
jgi:hypothetical protein